jgi:hypothetical protein
LTSKGRSPRTICSTLSVPHSLFHTICSTLTVPLSVLPQFDQQRAVAANYLLRVSRASLSNCNNRLFPPRVCADTFADVQQTNNQPTNQPHKKTKKNKKKQKKNKKNKKALQSSSRCSHTHLRVHRSSAAAIFFFNLSLYEILACTHRFVHTRHHGIHTHFTFMRSHGVRTFTLTFAFPNGMTNEHTHTHTHTHTNTHTHTHTHTNTHTHTHTCWQRLR